jgi:bifunctional DNase/RNase
MVRLPLRALPLIVLCAALVVGGTAARPSHDATERVELEVAGLLPMGEGEAAVLVLREKGTRNILPLVLPAARVGEHGGELRGPGLLGQAIEALGGRVSEVEIDRAEESRTGARVRLAQGGRRLELRGAPSESVALALSAKVPIVTTRRVIDESGLTPDDLAKAHTRARRGVERL